MKWAAAAVGAVLALTAFAKHDREPHPTWTGAQLGTLRSLSLSSLGPLPPDPSNAVADDPRAAALGKRLFSDRRLSANGRVSCATCHDPQRDFQDGRRLGRGIGVTKRRTMTLVGVGYAQWLFWDGRKDSLWSQALAPLAHPKEMGATRAHVEQVVRAHYRREFESVFGPLAARTEVFVEVGKSIEAFERTILPARSPFDEYVDAVARGRKSSAITARQARGLALFIGQAGCTNCHSGPLFTNGEFHNTGVPQTGEFDRGRAVGAREVLRDEFNCRGRFSDATRSDCVALEFIVATGRQLEGAFKPPSLRDVARRAPYTHAGRFDSLHVLLEHYRTAPRARVGHSELHPLTLSDGDLDDFEAFLRTLDGAR